MLAPCKKSYDQPRQHVKKQRHYFADKGPSSLSNGFSSSHVWMWGLVAKLYPTLATPWTTLSMGFSRQEYWNGLPFPSPRDLPNPGMCGLDHKESWVLKNWCFWTVVLEETLESPLDCKEIQPVNPKGDQSWVFIGRTDVAAEMPIFWPPDAKNWLIGKDPDAGKDWRQEEKAMTEDEMVGRHHWLSGQESEPALGDGERQGSLACCSPWGSQRVRHYWALNKTELMLCTAGNEQKEK